MIFGDEPICRNDPNLRYATPETRAFWAGLAQTFSKTITPAGRAMLSQFWALQLKLAKLLDESGTEMVAGSDPGGEWGIPGFSLHQDFDLLAQDGFAPLKVPQMTTLDGARFLGREASTGSLEVGKNADLVLLDANPVDSVQTLHGIAAVVRAGLFHDRHALDAMKRSVADSFGSASAGNKSRTFVGGNGDQQPARAVPHGRLPRIRPVSLTAHGPLASEPVRPSGGAIHG